VNQIELARQRLLGADGVPGVLSAGWEIFELVIAVAAASADQSADMFPAFTFARGSSLAGAAPCVRSRSSGHASSTPLFMLDDINGEDIAHTGRNVTS